MAHQVAEVLERFRTGSGVLNLVAAPGLLTSGQPREVLQQTAHDRGRRMMGMASTRSIRSGLGSLAVRLLLIVVLHVYDSSISALPEAEQVIPSHKIGGL